MGRARGAQNLLTGRGSRAPFRSSAGIAECRVGGPPGKRAGSPPSSFDGRGCRGGEGSWQSSQPWGVGAQALARNTAVSEARPTRPLRSSLRGLTLSGPPRLANAALSDPSRLAGRPEETGLSRGQNGGGLGNASWPPLIRISSSAGETASTLLPQAGAGGEGEEPVAVAVTAAAEDVASSGRPPPPGAGTRSRPDGPLGCGLSFCFFLAH